MAITTEQVTELRGVFEAKLVAREASKAAGQAARNVLTTGTAFYNAIAAIADTLPAHVLPPQDPSEDFKTFIADTASAWQAKPSEELVELRAKLNSYLTIADDLELPKDEVDALTAALARYGQATAVSDSTQRRSTGNGGSSPSLRARHLKGVPVITIQDPLGNDVRTPIKAGAQNGEGDAGSARYELKVVVDGLAEANGDDPATVWQEVVNSLDLGTLNKALVAVDDGEADAVSRDGTDRYGNQYFIQYNG